MPVKVTKLVLLSLLCLLVACASKEQSVKSKQAGLYFGAGTQALMEQDYTNALTNLMKAHELEPGNSDIITNLAMAYYFKGESDLAETYLMQALKLDKNNSDAKVNLATLYYQKGRINEAEKLYKLVLKDLTYEKQARTFYNLALLELETRKNVSAAKGYLLKAVKEDSNYCAAHMKLGMIYYQGREFTQALATFKDAVQGTCYEAPAPHFYQAMTLTELRRYAEARVKFIEIADRFRNDVYAVKARSKLVELKEHETNFTTSESRAPRKVFESPEF